MHASSKGHDKCVKFLLNKGSVVNYKDKVSAVLQSIIVCSLGKKVCITNGLCAQ